MFSYRFGTFLKSVQSIGSIKCRHFSTENTTAGKNDKILDFRILRLCYVIQFIF